MPFYREFTWFPGTQRDEVVRRVVEPHDAGGNNPAQIRGWYNLAGGGAGFLLVEYDGIGQLPAFLQPYMDLMSFDVRAVRELDYEHEIEQLRQVAGQSSGQRSVARHDFA